MCGNIKNYEVSFLRTVFVKSLLITCIVWSFMIVQLWWGDHDWGYIKNQVKIADGFFEVRYSQHLFSVFLFNGQVLPVLAVLGGIVSLVMLAMLLAIYLKVPQEKSIFYIFVLFVSLNPFIIVFFYYVYLALPFMAWPMVGVYNLILCEKTYSWKMFMLCSVIWFLILGSYPPNMALFLTVFTAKRIIRYCYGNEDIREIIKAYAYLGGQLVLAFVGFKITFNLLERYKFIQMDMYNIKMRGLGEIIANIPAEAVRSVSQFFNVYSFLEWDYSALLFLPIIAAVCLLYSVRGKNGLILSLLLIGMCLSSRFAFLVSPRSEVSAVRLEYFGRVGLYIFALAVIARQQRQCWKNLFLAWAFCVMVLFIRTDFEIQKVQFLSFGSGRKYQARLIDRLVSHPKFVNEKKYISFSFGNPKFQTHFLDSKNLLGEKIVYGLVFYHNVISMLFWEDNDNPVAIGVGINGASILRVSQDLESPYWLDKDYWQNNPENMSNIRYWLYMEAKQNGVYVDDKYIIMVSDMLDFYKHREMVGRQLDQ